jgi:uncharacterized protein (TIGR02996 family)
MDGPETAFWTAIAARPDDELPVLVFADWLDERHDARGTCLRWVIAEHKRPAFDKVDTKTWDWWSRTPADPLHYEIGPRQYTLPLNLFTRLTPFGPGIWKGKPEFIDALQSLCAAWKECIWDGAEPLGDDRPRSESDAGIAADSGPGV